jgi:hypothetical protein
VSGGDPRASVTQQYEISTIQTLCTVRYTVKIIKIIVIILTITQTATSWNITVCPNKKNWFSET